MRWQAGNNRANSRVIPGRLYTQSSEALGDISAKNLHIPKLNVEDSIPFTRFSWKTLFAAIFPSSSRTGSSGTGSATGQQ